MSKSYDFGTIMDKIKEIREGNNDDPNKAYSVLTSTTTMNDNVSWVRLAKRGIYLKQWRQQ